MHSFDARSTPTQYRTFKPQDTTAMTKIKIDLDDLHIATAIKAIAPYASFVGSKKKVCWEYFVGSSWQLQSAETVP